MFTDDITPRPDSTKRKEIKVPWDLHRMSKNVEKEQSAHQKNYIGNKKDVGVKLQKKDHHH